MRQEVKDAIGRLRKLCDNDADWEYQVGKWAEQAEKLRDALVKTEYLIVEDACDECGTFQGVKYHVKPVTNAIADYEKFIRGEL